jgi:hypothetical protein
MARWIAILSIVALRNGKSGVFGPAILAAGRCLKVAAKAVAAFNTNRRGQGGARGGRRPRAAKK